MKTAVSPISRAGGREIRHAAVLGMSQETRDALVRLNRRLDTGPVTLLGQPGPHRVLLDRARRAGALEGALDDPHAPTDTLAIPLTGASRAQRERWKRRGHDILDLSLPAILRTKATLGLLRLDHCFPILIGFRGDPECEAITGDNNGVAVVESTDDIHALDYAPRFGLLCQTGISRQRFHAIADALKARFRDSHLHAIDTRSPAAIQRENHLVTLARWADLILVLGDPADASSRALFESARIHGLPAKLITSPTELTQHDLSSFRRIGITAGEFTPDSEIIRLDATLNPP